MNFLVLGLPRSRTAWLANFLTYDGLHCSHEGIAKYTTLESYRDAFGENCGDSNTLLMSFDFMPYFQDTKIVVIDNSITTAVAFGKEQFNIDLEQSLGIAKERLDSIAGLHVNFEDINTSLELIWSYITDKPFDAKRAEMLIELNVQVNDVFGTDADTVIQLMENENVTLI